MPNGVITKVRPRPRAEAEEEVEMKAESGQIVLTGLMGLLKQWDQADKNAKDYWRGKLWMMVKLSIMSKRKSYLNTKLSEDRNMYTKRSQRKKEHQKQPSGSNYEKYPRPHSLGPYPVRESDNSEMIVLFE